MCIFVKVFINLEIRQALIIFN